MPILTLGQIAPYFGGPYWTTHVGCNASKSHGEEKKTAEATPRGSMRLDVTNKNPEDIMIVLPIIGLTCLIPLLPLIASTPSWLINLSGLLAATLLGSIALGAGIHWAKKTNQALHRLHEARSAYQANPADKQDISATLEHLQACKKTARSLIWPTTIAGTVLFFWMPALIPLPMRGDWIWIIANTASWIIMVSGGLLLVALNGHTRRL